MVAAAARGGGAIRGRGGGAMGWCDNGGLSRRARAGDAARTSESLVRQSPSPSAAALAPQPILCGLC